MTNTTNATDTTEPVSTAESTGTTRPATGRKQRRTRLSRVWINRLVRLATLVSAVAAAFAPASLTGDPVIDTFERMCFAAVVAFAAAHGHRWSWFAAAAVILVPARGAALALVVVATLFALWATTRPTRPKHIGAVIGGLLANACLWYTADLALPLVAICAVVGSSILVVSGVRAMRKQQKRTTMVPLLAALVITVVAVVGVVVGAVLTMSDLTAGTEAARDALASVEDGDTDTARIQLDSAQEHLDRADTILRPSTLVARLVPSLSQHVGALNVAVGESRKITLAADDLLASADYDKLRYQGRVDIQQVRSLAPGAVEVHEVLAEAESRLATAQNPWLAGPLRDRLDEFHTEVTDVRDTSELAADVLALAPGLFGGNEERRYLVVFLTPAELRGAGGFVGSYAELRAIGGRVTLAASGPIRDLIYQESFGSRRISGPPEYLQRYGRFRTADYLQDITYSPHFPYNAQVLAELYPQAGGNRVDGVIAVDPAGLAALLELTGPVDVEGYDEQLSSENAEQFLLKDQYLEFSDFDEEDGEASTTAEADAERKDFLAEATRATFQKLTSASLPAPAEIGRVLGPAVRARHLQIWSPRKAEQALFEQVGADSALDIPRGHDGFEVAQHNAGNNKIDAYLQRQIEYVAEVDPDTGRVRATMRITLNNEVTTTRLPSAVIGNRAGVPGHTNITWLSIFTPHRVVGATLDGERLSLGEEIEVGLYAYDTPFIHIPAQESVTLVLELEGALDLSDGYNLLIMPQPVANPDEVVVEVSASRRFEGPDAADGMVVHDGPMTEPIELSATFE